MEIAQIIWLVICGVVIIVGFCLGSYYLGEWKEACVDYAKYTAKAQMYSNSKDVSKQSYADEIAKNLVKKQICLPVWTVSFILVLIFLVIIALTLFK